MLKLLGLRLLKNIPKVNFRHISTSNKKSDVTSTTASLDSAEACEIKPKQRHWQSYGFNFDNETDDLNEMHSQGFFLISIGLCCSAFILAYRPEVGLEDWSQREGFLELRRREKAGLPLIDPNYADPANIVLPSDEELEDIPIII